MLLRFVARRKLGGAITKGVFAECLRLRQAGSVTEAVSMLEHGANLAESSEGPDGGAGALFYVHALWTGSGDSLRRAAAAKGTPTSGLAERALALRGDTARGDVPLTPLGEVYARLGGATPDTLEDTMTRARDALAEASSSNDAGSGSLADPASWINAMAWSDARMCGLVPGGAAGFVSRDDDATLAEAVEVEERPWRLEQEQGKDEKSLTAEAEDPLAAYIAREVELSLSASDVVSAVISADHDAAVSRADAMIKVLHLVGGGRQSTTPDPSASHGRDAAHEQRVAAHVSLAGRAYAARLAKRGDSEDFLIASGLYGSARRSLEATGLGGSYFAGEVSLWQGRMLLRIKGREKEGRRLVEAGQGIVDGFGKAATLQWWDRGGVLLRWAAARTASSGAGGAA